MKSVNITYHYIIVVLEPWHFALFCCIMIFLSLLLPLLSREARRFNPLQTIIPTKKKTCSERTWDYILKLISSAEVWTSWKWEFKAGMAHRDGRMTDNLTSPVYDSFMCQLQIFFFKVFIH